MNFYWLTFTDGTSACCEGQSRWDVVNIAEALSGKEVAGDTSYSGLDGNENIQSLPYPSRNAIWKFKHPVHGEHPSFCMHPAKCAGRTSCPRGWPGFTGRSCDD